MPWRDDASGGFTTGTPWLPLDPRHRPLSVAVQDAAAESPLNRFRRFMQWRRQQPALRDGDIRFLDAPEPVLAFVRTCGGQSLLAMFNLGGEAVALPLPAGVERVHDGHGLACGQVAGGQAQLPGYGVLFANLDALHTVAVT
jgi:alpha-glucosidase